MSLTGTPFFLTCIALVIVAIVLPLGLWGRIGGPRLVRGLVRFFMLLFAQVTAIALVFVMVNNANSLFDTWDDLLGTADHAGVAKDLGADGLGGKKISDVPRQLQKFEPATDPVMGAGVQQTQLKGRLSGVSGEVYVWLPPQYNDPAYRDKKFPVVEVLPGFPGSAKSWFGTLNAGEQLRPLMAQGKVKPFILVAPRTTLLGDVDTGCVNIPGKVNADTWLTVDVRKMVTDNFRASAKPGAWAVAGYSAGAHCAVKLALAHPDRYRAGIGLSGYNDPALETKSLAGRDPKLREQSNPINILKAADAAGKPPRTALYISGASGDGYQAGLGLQQLAKKPTTVKVKRIPSNAGGHSAAVWRNQVPEIFHWLSGLLKP
ncbi:alpha/beta hydrolase-fold protein [Streptomyces sp. MST-110588]|uniref:alpha/beta hydrolase n=1 Tax=Streptomyces sp. MST-110588 TaxID=2833628 RepID=UPI001F5C4F76|nr:alpha/beta hydrolase-fold protein [Streptomyces sp. MST-110588]UNO40336.1 esterase [Streptomyces sp. MST-110588]